MVSMCVAWRGSNYISLFDPLLYSHDKAEQTSFIKTSLRLGCSNEKSDVWIKLLIYLNMVQGFSSGNCLVEEISQPDDDASHLVIKLVCR